MTEVKRLIAMLLIFAVILVVCTGCSSPDNANNEKRVTHARIRYFDGSMDVLEVDRWFSSNSGTVTIYTTEGRKVVIGANNVILIEETKEQYEH